MASLADQTEKLFLRIKNPRELEHGSLPSFAFEQNRATIGSGAADWCLYASDGSVESMHAEINRMDGQFTLVDLCGQTYINDHCDALGRMHIVALRDTDVIRIGKYQISVNIGDQEVAAAYNVNHLRELEVGQLFLSQADKDWMDAMPDAPVGQEVKSSDGHQVLQQFLQNTDPYIANNPLHVMQASEARAAHEPDELERMLIPRFAMPPEPMAHMETSTSASITLKPVPRSLMAPEDQPQQTKPQDNLGVKVMMDDEYKDANKNASPSERQAAARPAQAVDHIVSGPLINSLGVQMEEMDTEQAHHFLHQSGSALQAAIQGLLALYQTDKENKINLALLGRSYQAIEDNPLRMGMSYEDTVNALFSPHKSRVHLAPEHAIEESMQNVRDSQLALIQAIQESLRQLLQAFAPEHLEKRFAHYRHQQEAGVTDDAWSWKMYQDYFAEMASSRQTGLEKMFWEIFEQSYDRAMRKAEKA